MTISAQRGGVILSNNTRSGYVKFIHPDGYGFVECDEDSIEDSYVHSSLVEKHELSSNDEITYSVSGKKRRESVSQIFSINGTEIKKNTCKFLGKVTGKVVKIVEQSGGGVIGLDDYCDEIYCNQKIVKKHELTVGDNIEHSIRPVKWGSRYDFEVSRIIALNGEMIREKVPSSIVGKKEFIFTPIKTTHQIVPVLHFRRR